MINLSGFTVKDNKLKLKNTADYETKSSYLLTLRTTDHDSYELSSSAKQFDIHVLDVNEIYGIKIILLIAKMFMGQIKMTYFTDLEVLIWFGDTRETKYKMEAQIDLKKCLPKQL